MSRVQLSHEIRAPARVVFDFADRHENYPDFFQGFSKMEWTAPRHQAGARLKMVGKLGGIDLPVELETTEVVPYSRISGIFVSGLRGSLEWRFEPGDGTTWVTLTADYHLPGGDAVRTANRGLVDHDLCCLMLRTLAAFKEKLENRGPAAG